MAALERTVSASDFEFCDEEAGVGDAAMFDGRASVDFHTEEDGPSSSSGARGGWRPQWARSAPASAPAPHKSDTERLNWGRNGNLSASQEAALHSMRQLVPHDSDENLLRYLRGKGFNVSKAIQLRTTSLEWWQDERAKFRATPATLQDHLLHRRLASFSDCLDQRGRPVVVIDASKHTPEYAAGAVAALLVIIEAALAVSPTGDITVVFDLRSYSNQNADMKSARELVTSLSNGFPERLGGAVIVGAPRIFSALWAVIRGFIDARTASKIHFVKNIASCIAVVGAASVPPSLGGQDFAANQRMHDFVAKHV